MKIKISNLLIVILFFSLHSCVKETIPIPEGLISIEVVSIELDETFVIRIHLPDSYSSSNLSYPVLYQLDGNTTTGSIIEDYNNLHANNKIVELIIVSIDYKNENNRFRDFTPSSHASFENSGRAIDFLNFLRHELIPKINSDFRTDLSFGNTLRGHSLGGLFSSYSLFKALEVDNVFSNFIIESPSWWWDDNFIFEMENTVALNNQDFPFKSYFSVGELEGATMKGAFEVMKKRIEERNYPNFISKFEILTNQSHLDVRESSNGLIYIFKI